MGDDTPNPNVFCTGLLPLAPRPGWRWDAGLENVRTSLRHIAEALAADPAAHFATGATGVLDWVQQVEPGLLDALRPHLATQRWETFGAFWVEPDAYTTSGEALVRQGLYAQRWLSQNLGAPARIACFTTAADLPATLPQILVKLGVRGVVVRRGIAPVYFWRAADGSGLPAARCYRVGSDYPTTEAAIEAGETDARIDETRALVALFAPGTTHFSEEKLPAVREALDAYGSNVGWTSLARAFAVFETDGAAHDYTGGLHEPALGGYATHAGIKRVIRETEHGLLEAERFATAAWLLRVERFPTVHLDRSWRNLLDNQTHLLLSGAGSPAAYEAARDQLGAARHRARSISQASAQAIARDIDTRDGGNTVVVFNPMTWPVRQPVTVDDRLTQGLNGVWQLFDDSDEPVDSQTVRGATPGETAHAFVAEVPAMGYRVYSARPGERRVHRTQDLEGTQHRLENETWRITFDPYTGLPRSLYDVRNHVELLAGGAYLAAVLDGADALGTGGAMRQNEAGRFTARQVRVVEAGEVLARVRADLAWGTSQAIIETTLYRELDVIDVRIDVDWHAPHHLLRLGFETAIADGVVTAEAPYGHETREPTGAEYPCQQWVDMTGTVGGLGYGFAILNDGCYAYSAHAGLLAMSLLRSPAYGHVAPAPLPAGEGYPIVDLGPHTFRFRLVPHAGPWQDARVVKQAWEHNLPPLVHVESQHAGKRPKSASLLGTEADNVLLSVLKQSEEGERIIVRGYEIHGRPAQTRLHLPAFRQAFDLHFEPYEIKTLQIDRNTWAHEEVSLLEAPL